MAALPDILVLRQGSTLYGLDPYSLQQVWVVQGKELVAGPMSFKGLLFVVEREVHRSSSGRGGAFSGGSGTTRTTPSFRLLEIAPDSGLLVGQKEISPVEALFSDVLERRRTRRFNGEPTQLLSVAESYVALLTESGRLDILGRSRTSAAAEPPPSDAGGLHLTLDPEDTHVWLDGSYLGSGGQVVENLYPGKHRLRLVHPDRRRLDTEVEVVPGQVTPLDLILERPYEGLVQFASTPAGAAVFVDGELRGRTPVTLYRYPAGQILQVSLERTGYRSVRQSLSVREGGAAISADLKLAPLTGGAFGVLGSTGTGPIRGWRETHIREGRVEGKPYRPADGDTYVKGVLSYEGGLARWRLFGRVGLGDQEEISTELEGGLWFAVGRGSRLELGASYLMLEATDLSSVPPRQGSGWSSTPDRSAPLERWHHPIPRVLVDNEDPSHLLARCRLRPRAGLFLELGAGRQMEKARLRGTALVEDAEGHLVRDPARSYDFTARNDGIVDARLQIALGTFRIWRFAPSTAVDIHYRHRWADFGPARESTGELTIGFGILYFSQRPGTTP